MLLLSSWFPYNCLLLSVIISPILAYVLTSESPIFNGLAKEVQLLPFQPWSPNQFINWNEKCYQNQHDLFNDSSAFEFLQGLGQYFPLTNQSSIPSETSLNQNKFEYLELKLACDRLAQTTLNYTINFLATAAGQRYEDFLPLYAFFALAYNNNSVVEMTVVNHQKFISKYHKSLIYLYERNYSFCVRSFTNPFSSSTKIAANTQRYFEVPKVRAEYTYIGDVDIFIIENVLTRNRFTQMKEFHLPYSNILRKNAHRLTGVMLVKTESFYTQQFVKLQQEYSYPNSILASLDEHVLYLLCKSSHGLPPLPQDHLPLTVYRPIHGLHLSYNRVGLISGMQNSLSPKLWCIIIQTPGFQEMLKVSPHQAEVMRDFVTNAILQHFVRLGLKARNNIE